MHVAATQASAAPLLGDFPRAPRRYAVAKAAAGGPARGSLEAFSERSGSPPHAARQQRKISPDAAPTKARQRAEFRHHPEPIRAEATDRGFPNAEALGGVSIGRASARPAMARQSSAYLAQQLAQEVMPESARAQASLLAQGVQAYRHALSHGIAIIGPADAQGLLV